MTKARSTGELLSVEAIRGRDLLPAARQLLKTKPKTEGGFSLWDASSIFYELHGLDANEHISARTLILLYAADLHFRLRWQINPALEEGQTVVAAPYVETGMAFGHAMGLPRRWLAEVFRFAPRPAATFWVPGSHAITSTATTGFLEFCGQFVGKDFVDHFGRHFEALERGGKCRKFPL